MGGWWVAGVGVEEGYGVIVEGTVDKFCLVCCFMMKRWFVCLNFGFLTKRWFVCLEYGGLKKRWLFV